jgi:WD40 repeat protein/serine/threonine protein kinase
MPSRDSSRPPGSATFSAALIETAYEHALELPPTEREAFLARACADDPELERLIRELLAKHAATHDSATETELLDPTTHARIQPEEAGQSIGPYKLIQQLGEGGFGVVWMAEQEAPVRRRVALKIIKLGMDTREIVARFEQERQALAVMEHPHIAKVFDAGATPTGRPFFVMELVDGRRINDFCDEAQLSTDDRLRLFIAVCHAVQHAHQKGIIHRDLKPSNILVTQRDGVPVPKIIDFGVAKATEQRLTDLTLFTLNEQMIGTPLYMSPEQAGLTGVDIDTRTDIYALGVILYELLTGRTPFNATELQKRGVDDIRRAIREQEPRRPSTSLGTLNTDDLGTLAQRRQVDGPRLVGQLRGDLDWIVMKAIEKDRERRYDTATAFADDLQRHLTSEPVVARPPRAGYLLQKLVRRNKTAFAFATAILLTLLGGIVVSACYAYQARQAELVAGRERMVAVSERDRALLAESAARVAEKDANVQRMKGEDSLYAANMNLAQGAWEEANISRLRGILDETHTYPHRSFEWFYWQRQIHLAQKTLHGHRSPIESVAFSADGRRMITGSQDKTAKVWDTETGRELLTLTGHTEAVAAAVFSPDGHRIVTASWDDTAKIWDAATGQELLTLSSPSAALPPSRSSSAPSTTPSLPHSNSPPASSSPSPTLPPAPSLSPPTTPAAVITPSGWPLIPSRNHTASLMSAAYSRDGRRIVTGGWDHTARLWDAATGRELLIFKGHTAPILAVAFAPDGRRVATASVDMTARIWDVETGHELRTLKMHTSWVSSVAFAPDGWRIVTGSWDHTARVWDAANGRELLVLQGHTAELGSVAFSPDGRRIATGGDDETARMWDAEDGREVLTLKGHTAPISAVAFSPDGRHILTGADDRTARLWAAEEGREPLTLEGHTAWVLSAGFSPDGLRVLTGSDDKTARVWDARTGRTLLTLAGHDGRVGAVAYSPDGHRLLTASWDRTARVWDAETGRELLALRGHTGSVYATAFSPDGRRIVTGSEDNTARVWDAATGQELLTLRSDAGWVWSVAFTADGQTIVAGNQDKSATVWDARTGQVLRTLLGHTEQINEVCTSHDGRRIVTASSDKTAKVWDLATGRELLTLRGHNGRVMSVSFAPDGKRIVTGSGDKTARVWDAETGRELLALKAHSGDIKSATFSPDGHQIVTASGDNTAKIWRIATAEEVVGWREEDHQTSEGRAPARP